ncbi:hypothetical protein Misp03_26130 [Microbispora sp. NBRC 16548]|nr:hypothetical protein Misp03_26130 [Microbispora sp. NBRC 16548]
MARFRVIVVVPSAFPVTVLRAGHREPGRNVEGIGAGTAACDFNCRDLLPVGGRSQ